MSSVDMNFWAINIILPDFTLLVAKQELLAVVKLGTLFHKIEHTVGLKMPLKGFT